MTPTSRSLRHPSCAGARCRPGRTSSGLAALRGLHLDTPSAPAKMAATKEPGKNDPPPSDGTRRLTACPPNGVSLSR
jgi:hypothetical protein